MKEAIKKILDISDKTYYNWKNQNRPIILLLELCFSENELNTFLINNQKPYKISYADNYFFTLYRSLMHYIVSNEGSKALFTTLFNNKDANRYHIEDLILDEFTKKNLDNYDIIKYFNEKPDEKLLLYIFYNIDNNWLILKESLKEDKWLIIYFEIFKLSIEMNIYDEVFGQPNKDIDECVVPKPPLLFASYHNNDVVEDKYSDILLEIKKSIIDGKYKNLAKYSPYDSAFNLHTKTIE